MKVWLNRLMNLILSLITLSAFLIIMSPRLSFLKLAAVLSGSMRPALQVGALAVTVPVKPENVREGDIIAFSSGKKSGESTSHRVIGIFRNEEGLFFRTKGDANEELDLEPVPAGNVCGRVIFQIPGLGRSIVRVMEYVRSWRGFVIFVILPSLTILMSAARDMKRQRHPRYRFLERRRLMQKAYRR